MLNVKQLQFDEIPVPEKNRKHTDIFCLYFAIIFWITMFGLSFYYYSSDNLHKLYYPQDQNSRICAVDYKTDKYIYYPNPKNTSNGICISSCPKQQNESLICQNSLCKINKSTYSSNQFKNIFGALYCIPAKIQIRKAIFQTQNNKFHLYFLFQNHIVILSIIISILIGIIYMVSFQIVPKFTFYLCNIASVLLNLIFGLFLLFSKLNDWGIFQKLKFAFGITIIIISILFLILNFVFYKQNKYALLLLQHSTNFLAQSFTIYLYIFLFILLTSIHFILIIWQHLVFSSAKIIKINQIYKSESFNVLVYLNIIQSIWGLQFLKDSCISLPIYQLYYIRKFFIMVSPSQNNDYHTVSKIFEAKCRQCNKWIIYQFNIPNPLISILFNLYVTKWHICRSCSRFLNFMWMETDAYTYMNLTGLPFCNSARNCQYIYSESNFFIGSQSPFRMYRISSNYFLITLVGVISYILMNLSIGNIGLLELILILYLSYAFCQIFIALHCDSAEGLSIIFLLEYVLSDQVYQNITRCPMKLKKDIQELQIQYMPKSRYQK